MQGIFITLYKLRRTRIPTLYSKLCRQMRKLQLSDQRRDAVLPKGNYNLNKQVYCQKCCNCSKSLQSKDVTNILFSRSNSSIEGVTEGKRVDSRGTTGEKKTIIFKKKSRLKSSRTRNFPKPPPPNSYTNKTYLNSKQIIVS